MNWRACFAMGLAGLANLCVWGQTPQAGTKPLKLPDGVTIDQLSDPKKAEKIAEILDKEHPDPKSEAARMLIAILRGSQLDGRDGWFGPAQSRYSWNWLAKRNGLEIGIKDSTAINDTKAGARSADGNKPGEKKPAAIKPPGLARDKFKGSLEIFDQLDRDGDGNITPSDLDWSPSNPYFMQANIISRVFRRMETSGNGKLTRAELDEFFQMVAKDKDHITADDLRRAMIPRGGAGFSPGDAPSIGVLVKGLFEGEIGSMGEGPKPGEKAPEFVLKTPDGKETISLASLTGTKPVVLIFGNFTCGPFRSLYPDVDAVYRRQKDKANFLMVYVREAHPKDGWKMDSNARMGVAVDQPKNYGERVEVCELFRKKLEPGMPVVVDDLSDPVGTAYSGMPARLYVIDAKGTIAYKSGRGPFGFKPGEMEQALLMSLLEAEAPPKP
jgi:hypothetical protein